MDQPFIPFDLQRMFFGKVTKPENEGLPDVNRRELLTLAPLAILVFVIGLFPSLLLNQISGAAARIQGDLQQRAEQNPAPRFYQGPFRLQARRPEAPPVPPAEAASGPTALK